MEFPSREELEEFWINGWDARESKGQNVLWTTWSHTGRRGMTSLSRTYMPLTRTSKYAYETWNLTSCCYLVTRLSDVSSTGTLEIGEVRISKWRLVAKVSRLLLRIILRT